MKKNILFVYLLILFIMPSFVYAADLGRINGDFVSARSTPGGTKIVSLLYGTEVTVLEKITKNKEDYYKVIYDGLNTGYISTDYVTLYKDVTLDDPIYCDELVQKGFDKSYCPYLSYVHSKHPKWTFTPLVTGLKFSDVIDGEDGSNYIQSENDAYRVSDKVMEVGSGTDWYLANRDLVAYFTDPRNFLVDKTIFMFENLGYDENKHKPEIVSSIFGKSSYLVSSLDAANNNASYIDYYMDAGKSYKISPVHLAARTKQEGGSKETYTAVTGKVTTLYGGKSVFGHYNYYSIGAYGSNPVMRGLAYAACIVSSGSCDKYSRPWTSRKKAIYGGANFLSSTYISKGQYTLYFEKFNTNPNSSNKVYTHQYMTNILAPYSEAKNLKASYEANGLINNGTNGVEDIAFDFVIPVYNNLPEKTYIPSLLNANNLLTYINVNGKAIANFDEDITSYNMYLLKDDNKVRIDAVAKSSTSKVEGIGEFELVDEENIFVVKVTAENGSVKEYTINIKVVTDTTTVPEIISKLGVKAKSTSLYGISTNTAVSTVLSSIEKISPNATKKIVGADGMEKTNGTVCTGDTLVLSTFTSPATTYVLVVNGDLNGDGVSDIKDLLKLQKHLLGTHKLDGILLIAADNNYDSSVDVVDLLRIQKNILKSIEL